MLRVFGITYSQTMNYGTCLQAYALQRATESIRILDGQGCEYDLISLPNCRDYPPEKANRKGKQLKNALMWFLTGMCRRSFALFEKKHMHYAECRSIKSIASMNEKADAFVCGSDVIWNPEFNHKLGLFYLDFAEKYKFSYAASFGKSDIQDPFLQTAGKWIAELNEIGVREQSAAEIVKKYAGRNAKVVADPVILLSGEDWNRIADEGKTKKGGIFSYTTHFTSDYKDFLRKLSERTGQKVETALSITKISDAFRHGIWKVQTPEKWLQQLRDAEYVVTNSFHATAFSVLFHKKFFTVVKGDRDKGINVRMNDFLTALGLEDRILTSVPDELDLSEIDYSEVDKRIDAMRQEGLAFLRENLEAAYRQKMEAEKQLPEDR